MATLAQLLVRFDNGVQIETDVLVGADGVHSVVRAGLSSRARLRYRGYTNWRGVTLAGSVPLSPRGWIRGDAEATSAYEWPPNFMVRRTQR